LLLAGCGPQASIPQGVQVFFSPKGGATEAVVNALDQATNNVLVQAYSFTSAPIAKALVDAHRRGVKVQVILDHSQRTEKYSEADFLKNSGIPTLIDAQHLLVINDPVLAKQYIENWHAHEQHSEAYEREGTPAAMKSEDRNPKAERRPKSEIRILH
jgi:phosphatidylserine/phosphatidylglycerophosphate/cardiolipin synthase-like enzyme